MSGELKREDIISAFHKTLVDFGYDDLTVEKTEEAIKKAVNESEGYERDVIAMFIHGWLNDEYKRLKPECERLFG